MTLCQLYHPTGNGKLNFFCLVNSRLQLTVNVFNSVLLPVLKGYWSIECLRVCRILLGLYLSVSLSLLSLSRTLSNAMSHTCSPCLVFLLLSLLVYLYFYLSIPVCPVCLNCLFLSSLASFLPHSFLPFLVYLSFLFAFSLPIPLSSVIILHLINMSFQVFVIMSKISISVCLSLSIPLII